MNQPRSRSLFWTLSMVVGLVALLEIVMLAMVPSLHETSAIIDPTARFESALVARAISAIRLAGGRIK